MSAVPRSVLLKRLRVHNVEAYFKTFLQALPSFKATDLALRFEEQPRPDYKERLLRALKNNYCFQSIECKFCFENETDGTVLQEMDLFDEAEKARLEIYLDRNHKLVQWTVKPKLVPQ